MKIIGVLLLLFVFAGTSEAKFITIETDIISAKIEKDAVTLKIGVANKGDEGAYNVKIGVDIGGKVLAGSLRDALEVNGKYTEEFTSPVGFKKPGKYPIVIFVDYTDRNQYPFTALAVVYPTYKEGVVGRAVGEMGKASISDKGVLGVKIKNLEDADKKVTIRIVLPKEFSGGDTKKEVEVKAGSEAAVSFDVKNIAALPGSSYQVYALLEYEDDKYHYGSAVGGVINVEEKKKALSAYKWSLAAIAVILTVMVAYLNLRKKGRKARPS